jgi:hypothetical protein
MHLLFSRIDEQPLPMTQLPPASNDPVAVCTEGGEEGAG